MAAVQNSVIDKIKRNRISTTEIADCLGKSGSIPSVYPLNRGHFKVGKVFWAYAYNESNWEMHEQISHAEDDSVIVIDAFHCGERAVLGSLVSKYLLLYRQVSAIVVCGLVRDVPHLIKENWPMWVQGVTPIGCFNKKNKEPIADALIKERSGMFLDAIAVCDDSGVVIIGPENQTESFLKKLDHIEEQEDIWFDCLDRLKWNTFDTVCLKKYKDGSTL